MMDKLNHLIRSQKRKYYNNFFEKNKNNMKKLWSKINSIIHKRKSYSGNMCLNIEGSIVTDPLEVGNKFDTFELNSNVSEYLSNSQTCQCKKSKFCYEPHGHVIIGDLRVIENAKLRELVAKGPKYREPNRVNWKATETMFLESIDLYAKNWSKREQVELKYLSEWKDQLKELVTDRISNLKGHFKSPKCKVLDQPDVKDTLHKLHANYVLVPADKAANNVIVVCKKYYIDALVKELGINNINSNNPTFIPIDDSFETIIKSHNQFITSVGLEMSEEDQNLPYLYWTPKLHKSPYKHRFIAGSSKCTTKDLSCLLTKLLSTI